MLFLVDVLNLTLEDVGSRIKLVYTPVRKDSVVGTSVSVVSDVIEDGIFDQTTLLNIIFFLGSTIEYNIMKPPTMKMMQRIQHCVCFAADPVGISLVIPDCSEDVEVVPQRSYFGGIEGDVKFAWFRLQEVLRGNELSPDAEFLGESR